MFDHDPAFCGLLAVSLYGIRPIVRVENEPQRRMKAQREEKTE
jgi:hypothetical protein